MKSFGTTTFCVPCSTSTIEVSVYICVSVVFGLVQASMSRIVNASIRLSSIIFIGSYWSCHL